MQMLNMAGYIILAGVLTIMMFVAFRLIRGSAKVNRTVRAAVVRARGSLSVGRRGTAQITTR